MKHLEMAVEELAIKYAQELVNKNNVLAEYHKLREELEELKAENGKLRQEIKPEEEK